MFGRGQGEAKRACACKTMKMPRTSHEGWHRPWQARGQGVSGGGSHRRRNRLSGAGALMHRPAMVCLLRSRGVRRSSRSRVSRSRRGRGLSRVVVHHLMVMMDCVVGRLLGRGGVSRGVRRRGGGRGFGRGGRGWRRAWRWRRRLRQNGRGGQSGSQHSRSDQGELHGVSNKGKQR
jgi:hypothetical protein